MAKLTNESTALKQDELGSSEEIKLLKFEENIRENDIPIIDGVSLTQAFKIGNKVQDESRKLWSSKKVILKELKELNKRNTYSFIGYMITTSKTQTPIFDIKNYITYDGLIHIVSCMLSQAEDCNLNQSFQYKKLRKCYYEIVTKKTSSLFQKVNSKLMKETNLYLENMYLEMSKVLH